MPTSCKTRRAMVLAGGLLASLAIIGCGSSNNAAPAARLTTRQRTVHPVAVAAGHPITPGQVALYGTYGYSTWREGPGEDLGRKFNLMPAGYTGSPNAAQLASFFTMSDIHITDKESPAQVPYFGFVAPFVTGGLYSSAYSPVMLSTTQMLDAAVRTVNALHVQSPLNFGVMLGDMANSSQYNELRWFVDVLDGKPITPSSGAHLGADTIDYQKPFQAAGLNPAIPWYATVGNHDQYWMGVNF
ncbi:MAG: TIGR03768 family metallophosphoesterase, partial [Armatimonadetes bacterium]|nr:TIGR03768 family metallophosphoesterase [Armatimonadota bacterium]